MELERGIVYGPIYSRRFKWDLGINLLPWDHKLCTFDCVYCQYGFTPQSYNDCFRFPSTGEVIEEWSKQLKSCSERNIPVEHTTVAGNGEPTMHPHFVEVVTSLANWREQNAPHVRLALLSNGYRLHDASIREALRHFDEPIIKLDSANPEKQRMINQPRTHFNLIQLIEDLKKCDSVIIQTMFLKGWNDSAEDQREWREALRQIRPVEVQIYTASRPPAMSGVRPLRDFELQAIAEYTSVMLDIPVRAYL